jgi:hypothetical protein
MPSTTISHRIAHFLGDLAVNLCIVPRLQGRQLQKSIAFPMDWMCGKDVAVKEIVFHIGVDRHTYQRG